mgnify:FL=1
MKKLIKALNKTEEVVLVAMFALMVVIIFIQVIMRYVFQNSLYWSEELGKFLFIWISWLGISFGEKRGEHIKITLIVDKFSNKAQYIANIISEIIVIAICAVTVYYGITMVILQTTTNYAGIKISVDWGYLAVVVGCAIMMLRCIGMIVLSVKGMKSGQPLHEMMEELVAKYDAELEG